jgi:hypothetical protein
MLAAGSHDVPWDGRGHDGRRLANGVYLARVVAGERVLATQRLVVTR